VRKFNEEAAALNGVKVVCVSQDLPFALNRFCSGEGIENVIPASAFRDKEFGEKLGILITDGPLEGLFARAVVVINDEGSVLYSQLVPEIAEEPDYAAALKAVQG
jgi:thiol peroxidase